MTKILGYDAALRHCAIASEYQCVFGNAQVWAKQLLTHCCAVAYAGNACLLW